MAPRATQWDALFSVLTSDDIYSEWRLENGARKPEPPGATFRIVGVPSTKAHDR
jgi:hypothetical protein